MRLTFIQPAVGHRAGEAYMRTWQMEPLPIATLAGITPPGVTLALHDDRMEAIPYDAPTDAVAMPVETYTATRAYQIASEYRRRGVPVVMGGFHATLVPEEAERYADAIVIGEGEGVWPRVIDDLRHRTLQRRYHGEKRPLSEIRVDRRLFAGKGYLPIGLVETGRGCPFACEFCAVSAFYKPSYRARPPEDVVKEIAAIKEKKRLFFFVSDNFAGDLQAGKPLLAELARLRIRWVTQMSIHAAHDEEFVAELHRAGCRGVLIGFESLNEANLRTMHKRFNTMRGGFRHALANLRRHRIGVYGTFIFGYEADTESSFDEAVAFATEERMYLAAFNHLVPFPGTALYRRLEDDGRLLYRAWWRDPGYRFNTVAFAPRRLTPRQIRDGCIGARRSFYRWSSIAHRSLGNTGDAFMFGNYFLANALQRHEVGQRDGYPLGDTTWHGKLLEVR